MDVVPRAALAAHVETAILINHSPEWRGEQLGQAGIESRFLNAAPQDPLEPCALKFAPAPYSF